MKCLFLYLIAFSLVINSIAQTTAPSVTNTQKISINDRWDSNKYLWSHTNYKTGKGDKPVLNYDVMDDWKTLGPDNTLSISSDGKYFTYSLSKDGLFKGMAGYDLVESITVKSITGAWQYDLGKNNGFFSADSKQYIFQENDELCFLELGSSKIRRVKDVLYFSQPFKGKGEWLAYQLKTEGTVVLENLVTGKEKRFPGASGFMFDNSATWFTYKASNGELLLYHLATEKELRFPPVEAYAFNTNSTSLVLQTSEKTAAGTVNALHHVSLPEGEKKTIWTSTDTTATISTFSPADNNSRQVLFTIQKIKGDVDEYVIGYWKEGMDKALEIDSKSPGINDGLVIAGPIERLPGAMFAGKYIVFALQLPTEVLPKAKNPITMEIWSYKDTVLQSTQPALLRQGPKAYVAVFNIDTKQVTRVEQEDESIIALPQEDFVVVQKLASTVSGDRFWEAENKEDSIWLMSVKDGSRRLLPISKGSLAGAASPCCWFAPGGRYLVYNDPKRACNYFSYDLQTGRTVNISAAVPAWQLSVSSQNITTKNKSGWRIGVAGWVGTNKAMLVYDEFDIWQLDLSGQKPAINITGGYGRAHHTSLSLFNSDRSNSPSLIFGEKDSLLLKAFNLQTKYNGYFRKVLGSAGNPELLYMGPCFIQGLFGTSVVDLGIQPLKAATANVWIVKKQTATEAPNYFVTTDFKTYRALTDNQPHKEYNWLTSELVSFKLLDGTPAQGILYKPENFDPSKKYPVIVSFYTSVSDRLYQYLAPRYIRSPIIIGNPAWMVSHGYLVFIPDMHFAQGQWGPGTVNTVDGAARYLKTLPYVDGEKLAATGHSNSGRFGFYLLSHSTSFAAMCIGEGTSNILSVGLAIGLLEDGEAMMEWAEQGSAGTGLGMLWKNKASWLDHSAVLSADKVTSPLLLFDNKDGLRKDQATQLYMSLRRLNKKAWWLHYDNGNHALGHPLYLKDFTLRYTQFFDHYLQNTPAPRWMVAGIPFKLKGIESRYELDPTGSCSIPGKKECPICKAWNVQYKRTPQMFEKPISAWKLDSDIKAVMNKEKKAQYDENMKGEALRIQENNMKLKSGNK